MDAPARKALATIRRCIEADRVRLTRHFTRRLDQRGMVWPDVLSVFESPAGVRGDGIDDWGRARWIVSGDAADPGGGTPIEVVCLIERNEAGHLTVLVTIHYRKD